MDQRKLLSCGRNIIITCSIVLKAATLHWTALIMTKMLQSHHKKSMMLLWSLKITRRGVDKISAEHLKFASKNKLYPLLAICFTGFIFHAILPDSILPVVLVPITKGKVHNVNGVFWHLKSLWSCQPWKNILEVAQWRSSAVSFKDSGLLVCPPGNIREMGSFYVLSI